MLDKFSLDYIMENPIDSKQNEKEQNNLQYDWQSFGVAVLYISIVVIIWALLGANILFFARLNKEELEAVFPANINSAPYDASDSSYQSGGKSKRNYRRQKGGDGANNVQYLMDKLSFFLGYNNPDASFPYKYYDEPATSMKNDVINMFAGPVTKSYSTGRKFLQSFFGGINTKNNYFIESIIYLLSPLLIGIMILSTFAYGWFSTIIFEVSMLSPFSITKIGTLIVLFCTTFGIIFFPFVISMTQTIQMILTLLFAPLYLNNPDAGNNSYLNIISDNSFMMVVMYIAFVALSAFKHLGQSVGWSMIGTLGFIMLMHLKNRQ